MDQFENIENLPEAETSTQETEAAEGEIFPSDAEQNAADDAEHAAQKPARWKKELREWLIALAAAALIAFVIRSCLFMFIRVDGNSMNNTLKNGEFLFVTIADMKLMSPERGDVVICRYPNRKEHFVKRLVGVPGDQVERVCGVTYVIYTNESGQTVREAMDERYASRWPNGCPDDYEPYTLGEDEYFVVGDNRYDSHDSRDWKDRDPSRDVGPITGKMLVGRVRCVLWPPERTFTTPDERK